MKKYYLTVLAALALAACGSSGKKVANDFTDKLLPTPKPGAGLQAMNLSGIAPSGADVVITIGGKTYQGESLKNVDIAQYLPNTVNTVDYTYQINGHKSSDKAYLYKNKYSVVLGYNTIKEPKVDQHYTHIIDGQLTKSEKLPQAGVFSYRGNAFHKGEAGKLQYKVDFGAQTGEGYITDLTTTGNITLEKTRFEKLDAINDDGRGHIDGSANSDKLGKGAYTLSFFGDNAAEIAGEVGFGSAGATQVGFGGTKQPSISK